MRADRVGDVAQQLISGAVAQRVVCRLEVVDVDERERERLLGAPGAVDFACELHQARVPVIGAGELVDRRRRSLLCGQRAVCAGGVPVLCRLDAIARSAATVAQRSQTVRDRAWIHHAASMLAGLGALVASVCSVVAGIRFLIVCVGSLIALVRGPVAI
ncbi:MAG: hypothetical protein QOF69_1271 [Solirubrobacteraceae bacterium]|nr:hypothetical protein [Solirubrobacteraceae bacterium]